MNDTPNEPKPKKLSPVEGIKTSSNYLRGDLAEELVDGNAYFGKESIQLIKHHGSYQQDNRDLRKAARAEGVPKGKYFSLMIRTAIPGGKLTPAQLLAELDLCDEVGDATLRVTTRQGLQLHGVLKKNLKRVIAKINEIDLSTLAACGDVRRNVMCSPVPYKNSIHETLQRQANELAHHLRPRTGAYRDLWLKDPETGDKEKVDLACVNDFVTQEPNGKTPDAVEPLYGKTYLPRKFKFALGLPGDNSVDLYSQDCGLMAICDGETLLGYNVLVGGGFGTTPSNNNTFPALAKPLAFVTPDQVLRIAESLVKVHRDFGDRENRKRARLKYIVHDWGMEKFKQVTEEYFGGPLPEPKPITVTGYDDGMGWREQGDGKWFYGLNIENGRIKNDGTFQLKTALREVCQEFSGTIFLTPHQGMIFSDIEEGNKTKLEAIFRKHGVPLTEEISIVRQWSMACPAMPTCGLAVTESERVLPSLLDALEVELEKLGLKDEVFTTRMTGCPNGCARPYNSDIAFVGKAKDKYTVFLGGRIEGDRLNFIHKDMVPFDDVIPTVAKVLTRFKQEREAKESFGDFCFRIKAELAEG